MTIAQLEIAKMRYATGRYEESLRILEDSGACDEMDEACLFYGLSALSLGRCVWCSGPKVSISPRISDGLSSSSRVTKRGSSWDV